MKSPRFLMFKRAFVPLSLFERSPSDFFDALGVDASEGAYIRKLSRPLFSTLCEHPGYADYCIIFDVGSEAELGDGDDHDYVWVTVLMPWGKLFRFDGAWLGSEFLGADTLPFEFSRGVWHAVGSEVPLFIDHDAMVKYEILEVRKAYEAVNSRAPDSLIAFLLWTIAPVPCDVDTE